jgi:hypothetical protein
MKLNLITHILFAVMLLGCYRIPLALLLHFEAENGRQGLNF